MNRTIRAIMRHMVRPPGRTNSTNVPTQPTTAGVVRRKPERKLHVVYVPPRPIP